jgi:hypothetical protein
MHDPIIQRCVRFQDAIEPQLPWPEFGLRMFRDSTHLLIYQTKQLYAKLGSSHGQHSFNTLFSILKVLLMTVTYATSTLVSNTNELA